MLPLLHKHEFLREITETNVKTIKNQITKRPQMEKKIPFHQWPNLSAKNPTTRKKPKIPTKIC